MIVEGEFRFQGPRAVVWDLLQDPTVLVKALPGARTLDRTGDDRFQGVMAVSLGPVSAGEFTVSVALSEKQPPATFSMEIEGKSSVGFARGNARVALSEAEGGATLMRYRADLQIGGKIAGVGQRVIDSAARLMTRQGLEALNQELVSRLAAGAGVAVEQASQPRAATGGTSRIRPAHWVAGVLLLLVAMFFTCGVMP